MEGLFDFIAWGGEAEEAERRYRVLPAPADAPVTPYTVRTRDGQVIYAEGDLDGARRSAAAGLPVALVREDGVRFIEPEDIESIEPGLAG